MRQTNSKNSALTLEARQPEDLPAKADPGTRARHFLTDAQAKRLVKIAKKAAEIREVEDRGERGRQFHDLAAARQMRHETLLKWGFLYQAFGEKLRPLLIELGKTKLYVLSYVKDPVAALDDGIPDRKRPERVLDVRSVSAEVLRRHIRAQQEDPDRGKRHWFRIDRERNKREQARAVADALKRTEAWLLEDVQRVVHRIVEGASPVERKRIRSFRNTLREQAQTITAALSGSSPK